MTIDSNELNPRDGLEQHILREAARHDLLPYLLTQPLVVGVSGGADSLALLHILRALRGDAAHATLHVAHLNHWFRGVEGKEDAEFVRDTAAAWGLSCTVESFDVPNYARRARLSTEDAARRVRYAFLASLARGRGAGVAVAHNADDQVETVLMSILRGTGLSGLAGMQPLGTVHLPPPDDMIAAFAPPSASGEPVPLFRPLLSVWRHQIVEYCEQAGLQPRFDSTNWERIYKRNRVRHDLIPLLQMQYSLAIKEHLFNLSLIAHGEDELLESFVDKEWARIALTEGDEDDDEDDMEGDNAGVRFRAKEFAALPQAMQRRLARRAISTVAGTLQDITFAHIEAAIAILAATPGSQAAMHLPHGLVVARQGEWSSIGERGEPGAGITISKSAEWPTVEPGTELPISPGDIISLENGWQLEVAILEAGELHPQPSALEALFDYDALLQLGPPMLRTRQPGDYIQPLGMAGRKSLQDLMVDAKIPREWRDRIPLLATGTGEVLWVPGRGGRRSRQALITEETRRVLHIKFSTGG